MNLGEQISFLRKKKKLSQNELGKRAGTSGILIGKYERNETKPSIDVVIRIANVLEVSIDYLVGKTNFEIDDEILKRIENILSLPPEKKELIFTVVDALIRDYKAGLAYK